MAANHAQVVKWRDELTPNIVDQLAKAKPDGAYALYPKSPVTYEEGYRTITYKDFANAINGLAWWLKETLGPATDDNVVAYLGPNDIRYNALMLGANKAGYLTFFPSPRNSIAAHSELFKKTKCGTLITSNPAPPGVEVILSVHPMKHIQIPSVTDLLESSHPHYPYDKTYEGNKMDRIAIVHTSGTTGIPKPIIWTHESFTRHMKMTSLKPWENLESVHKLHQGKRILNTFPHFHAGSYGIGLLSSLPYGTVPIFPISGAIPSAEGVVQALKSAPAEVAFLIPLIAAELAQKPDLLEYCSRHLKHIFYCGGHLPQAVGDVIAAKVPIHNQYGASEIGLSNQVFPRGMAATDWQYVQFHGDLGYEFEEITPGLFELIIRRHPIEAFYGHQVTFSMELQEQVQSVYRSRDLFEKHPTLPDTWAWRARADDIIVFLTGEKTNPISMELYIVAKNDEVANAMVVGMQRFQAALIIEPAASVGKLSPSEATEFIDKIWPSIEEANKVTPAHARVEKALVMLTDPDKPIIRSMKGTIQRYATITQYASEIDDLYSSLWNNEVSDLKPAYINTNHADEMSSFIARAIREIDRDFLHHYDDNDFFAWGMDSQVAMRLVRALAHGLGRKDLNISVVYNNPTLKQLASYLASGDGENSEAINSNTDLQAILDEYGQEVDGMSSDDYPAKPLHTVLLTGSTGSLGTYLLEAFLTRPDVAHVYCLNKRWNAENIHQTKAQANGFPLEKHRHRVSFITVRLDQPRLGLEEMTYNILLSMATLIVHNAWEVNFLKDISGFRSQLDGLTNLLRLASRYDSPPKVLFVSSVSSVARLAASSDTPVIPEKIIEDLSTAQDIGYAKSKLLGELICDRAARRHALPVSVARVGQIAGPVRENSADPWNVSEWLPSLIKTSMGFGAIPDDLGAELNRIDWVPADLLAEALVELTIKPPKKDEGVGAEIFNVVNPHAVTWKEVLPFILSGLERHASRKLSVVSAQSWLELLQKAADNFSAGNTTLIHSHPAIKLKDFYAKAMLNRGGVVGWETGGATTGSKVLKEMPPVGSQWVQKWIQGWVEKLAPQSSSSE